jgi:hypothetical protein
MINQAAELCQTALHCYEDNNQVYARLCSHIATFKWTHYATSGDEDTLDDALQHQRRALSLYAPSHPGRIQLYHQLAIILRSRFDRIGDIALLDETVEVGRHALAMCPVGHRKRARCLNNLSIILRISYTQDHAVLDEVIALQTESLQLRDPLQPGKATVYGQLASLIGMCYMTQPGTDIGMLRDSVRLQLQALAIWEDGYPSAVIPALNLVDGLITLHEQDDHPDPELSLELQGLCAQISSVSNPPSQALTSQARCHLLTNSPLFNLDLAITETSRAVTLVLDKAHFHVTAIQMLLRKIESYELSDVQQQLVVSIYVDFLAVVPLIADMVLDRTAQLQALHQLGSLASDAFPAALSAGDLEVGVELVEHARATVWSQALHLREPQLDNIPPHIASELQQLLRSVQSHSDGVSNGNSSSSTATDARHTAGGQIRATLRNIRSIPGKERFMLGQPYSELCRVSDKHFVVMLISGKVTCHAIVMTGTATGLHLVPLHFSGDTLVTLQSSSLNGLRGSSAGLEDDGDRGLSISRPASGMEGTLRRLWFQIVKPIFDHLELKVRKSGIRGMSSAHISKAANHWEESSASSLVSHRAVHSAPDPRGWDLYRFTSNLMLGLRCFIVHSYTVGAFACPGATNGASA